MKFKELLDIMVDNENLYVTVGNDYDCFEGTKKDFLANENFLDLEVLDMNTKACKGNGCIDRNKYLIQTELQISLYDKDFKVLEPIEDD